MTAPQDGLEAFGFALMAVFALTVILMIAWERG